MKTIWPFTFNLVVFAGFAFVVPFLVLYYQSVGFSGAEIGLLTGVTPLVTLVAAPFWTGLADAKRRHRLILSVALVLAAVIIFVFPFLNSFVPVFLIAILFSAFFAPVTSFADSATMFMLADRKDMYGRVRLGGTIGFGVAGSLAGALVLTYGLNFAFWGCAALLLLALFVGQKLVYNPLRASASAMRGVRTLLTNRRWLLFMTLAFAGGLAIAATNTYLFPFLRELGADEFTMGNALTLGTVSEIPVLFFGHRLLQRFKPYGLLVLAMVITGVRLIAFAASDTPTLAFIIQLFNGLTFPAMWIAGVAYADEHAPAGLSATAQGMFGAMVFGFGAAVGGFVGGPLLESVGGRGLFFIFGIVVLIVVAIVALVQRRLPAELKTAPTVAMN